MKTKQSSCKKVDVLCVGHACYDLIFSVTQHPGADEKIVAGDFNACGGGPAANAAVCVARLGYNAAFAGFLGEDIYGEKHLDELLQNGIDIRLVVRGPSPTPLSTILVKPDGKRALINYKGATEALAIDAIDFSSLQPAVILFDGHEPHVSLALAEQAKQEGIPMVLDAGSVHEGTLTLMNRVDYLVCSEKFARQFAGDIQNALDRLAKVAPSIIITLGEKGLIWQRDQQQGTLPAYEVNTVDSTGAGDAFHGAFAVALAAGLPWLKMLQYASAAGALCCTKIGARQGLPTQSAHAAFLANLRDC